MCNDLFYFFSKMFSNLLPAKRHRLTSTQFRKMALFFSVYDDNFYQTTNLTRLIYPRFVWAKGVTVFLDIVSLEAFNSNSRRTIQILYAQWQRMRIETGPLSLSIYIYIYSLHLPRLYPFRAEVSE